MRLRTQSYHNLDGVPRTVVVIPWYWRAVAVAAPIMILGGFLMLPATFTAVPDTDLRIPSLAIGIFAAAILLAGICSTVLACVVVHDLTFQLTEVFRPALISCVLGLLTVFWSQIITKRNGWTPPAIATLTASTVFTIVYTLLYVWTQRKINVRSVMPSHIPLNPDDEAAQNGRWQSPAYYQNYIKNMFPTATVTYPAPSGSITPASRSFRDRSNSISEDEMQRQQMLMLLNTQDTPHIGGNTFQIEWQGSEHDHDTPIQSRRTGTLSAHGTNRSLSMRFPANVEWDGVMRGIAPRSSHARHASREARRQQIEQGR